MNDLIERADTALAPAGRLQLALESILDRLVTATSNEELLKLRDAADSVQFVSAKGKLDDIAVKASVAKARVEREIAKANPPTHPKVSGGMRRCNLEDTPIPKMELSRMRQAHEGLSDEQFESQMLQAEQEKEPVTRKALHDASRRNKRKESEARSMAAAEEREGRERADSVNIRNCGISDFADVLGPESVDAIITDPPYKPSAIPLYRDLRDFASGTLKPGGHLVVMTGCMFLPQWIGQLEGDPSIQWRFLVGVNMMGANTVVHPRAMAERMKPVLLYEKAGDHKDGRRRVCNLIDSETKRGQHDEHHKWQQSLDVFTHLLARFASPGDTVCDPFLGGGTTAVAAIARGCAFAGCDIDAGAVETSRKRIGLTP